MTTRQDASDNRQGVMDDRLIKVEQAVIQFNHFTKTIEKLDLASWKADVMADMRWLKYLLGTGAAAGVFQVILSVIKELK